MKEEAVAVRNSFCVYIKRKREREMDEERERGRERERERGRERERERGRDGGNNP